MTQTPVIRFGYTIVYVPNVAHTAQHYQDAFGLTLKFLHESGSYAEMATGQTTLAFAGEDLAEMHGFALRPNRKTDVAGGFEIALVCADPDAAYARAITHGASALSPPKDMPWGQRVSYVRDINGCIVELCSEVRE
jgi:lactoylglutathione lyase